MPRLSTKRTASIALAATAATAALCLALVTSASATSERADSAAPASGSSVAAAPSVSGSPEAAFTRIADFYGSYIDAVYDNEGETAQRLRALYLSRPLQDELRAWEEANQADGVLRAQNVPSQWKVTSTGSGTGKTTATITLTWGGGDTTQIYVQADLRTRKIVSIKD
ncbi:hypothetical protein [Streptomyces sp. NBC_01565]|uniref:hypothetical protein n=1 Tax=unclassified Streptomyces TaxID=2593676 RepID=UPI0022592A21|nr:hypothetical protein [Streptomyces sp. NBC_01565]MCX4539603.1 IS66 family transposase [Streptomyces sp. NBC_01565]